MKIVRTIARPRIHVGLVDLSGASLRSYGGVGFALDGRHTIWRVEHAQNSSIHGTGHLDEAAQRDLAELEGRLKAVCRGEGYKATLECVADQHIGLGSKTALCMSLISAVNTLNKLELAPSRMIELSDRGGASGAGVNLFFTGGAVWDGGQSRLREQAHLPSSMQGPAKPPPLLGRWAFPSTWQVALMLPAGILASGEYERNFFIRNTPLPKVEALETMSIMYHGVIAGLATEDRSLLRQALVELHRVGFKSRELLGQSEATKSMLRYLQANTDFPVGMSSMGPLLYAVIRKGDHRATSFLRTACGGRETTFMDVLDGWNLAHEILKQ